MASKPYFNTLHSNAKTIFDGVDKFVRVRNPAKNSALHLDLLVD